MKTSTDDLPDFRTRLFWEEVMKDGPMALTKHNWRFIEDKLDPSSRKILRYLLDGMEDQTRWIQKRTDEMREEAEKVALIGRTMRKAGLRSYTDEKGRIYIAATE